MYTKRFFYLKKLVMLSFILVLAASFYSPAPALAGFDNGTWVARASMLTPRTNFGMAVVGGQVYAIGGVNLANQSLASVEAYDPATDTWAPRPNLPNMLLSPRAAVANGKIYAFGNSVTNLFNVYEYDPANNSWVLKIGNGPPRTGFSVVAAADNQIYILGGINNNVLLPTVLKYDPFTNILNTSSPMPFGLANFGAALGDNGKIYTVGGTAAAGDSSVVQEFDPVAGTWALAAALPAPRSFISAASFKGEIYAVGGKSGSIVTRNVFHYNPLAANPSWFTRTSLLDTPESNAFPVQGAASFNGKMYAIGPNFNQEFTITDTSVTLVPSATEVYVGETLTVNINVENASDLYAMQATCTTDPTELTFTGASFGSLFDPVNNLVGINSPDPQSEPWLGTWKGAISQRNPALPITGAGTMATLSFTARQIGAGTPIDCLPLLSDQNGFDLPFTYTGTVIAVLEAISTVNGTVTYQGRLSHAGILVTFSLAGTTVGSTTTDSTGAFAFDLSTGGSYTIEESATSYLSICQTVDLSSGQVLTLPSTELRGGDTNGNGSIEIGDATLIGANFGTAVPPALPAADINADAVVNVQDLAILGGNFGSVSNCLP